MPDFRLQTIDCEAIIVWHPTSNFLHLPYWFITVCKNLQDLLYPKTAASIGIIVRKTHNAAFTPKKAANLFACLGIWLFERAATNKQIPK
jgi:hypothetical protein